MAVTTAEEMAKQAGVSPKTFRRALRKEKFAWHAHYDRWTVTVGGIEYTAMQRALGKLSN